MIAFDINVPLENGYHAVRASMDNWTSALVAIELRQGPHVSTVVLDIGKRILLGTHPDMQPGAIGALLAPIKARLSVERARALLGDELIVVERGASCEELEVWGVFLTLREAAAHARETTRDPLDHFSFWRTALQLPDEVLETPRRIDEAELVDLGLAVRVEVYDASGRLRRHAYAWERT